MNGHSVEADGTGGTATRRPHPLRCPSISGNIPAIGTPKRRSNRPCKARITVTNRTTLWCANTIRRNKYKVRLHRRLFNAQHRESSRRDIPDRKGASVPTHHHRSSKARQPSLMHNRCKGEVKTCRGQHRPQPRSNGPEKSCRGQHRPQLRHKGELRQSSRQVRSLSMRQSSISSRSPRRTAREQHRRVKRLRSNQRRGRGQANRKITRTLASAAKTRRSNATFAWPV